MARPLKIGDKVRHTDTNMEGYVVYSSFGLSVNCYAYHDDELIHISTQGVPREEVEKYWKRVYKWKHNMLRYELEREKQNEELD